LILVKHFFVTALKRMNLMSGSLASKVRCTALHIPLLRNTQRASAGVRFQKKNHVLADRTLAEEVAGVQEWQELQHEESALIF
jgi:hypothetical protein